MASLGDIVRLDPVKPMSKTKRFAVAEIVKKGE
jgi:ribosomal protein S17